MNGNAALREMMNAERSASAVAIHCHMEAASHAAATASIKQNAEKSTEEYVAISIVTKISCCVE